MKALSIIFPIYNEQKILVDLLKEWDRELTKLSLPYEFILCEDGSTDGTKEMIESLKSQYPIIVNQKPQRRGYGRAVIDGIKTARTEYVLCVDSDRQCVPADVGVFWEKRQKADVLIGWRTKRADSVSRLLFSFLFKRYFDLLFVNNIHDPSCPFVMFKKHTIVPFVSYLVYMKEGFWWGFVAMCLKKNLALLEIPVHHRPRAYGITQVYKIGKLAGIILDNCRGLWQLKNKP